MTVITKLINARKSIKPVLKDANVAGEYMAVTHDAVTRACRDAMNEQGLLLYANTIKHNITKLGTTESGFDIIRFEAEYLFSLTDSELAIESDELTFMVVAHALDTGDKAPGKAESYAYKRAMLKLFMIETGENDEERLEKSASVPAELSDTVKLAEVIKSYYPKKAEAVYQRVYEKYNVTSINQLTKAQVDGLIASIEAAHATTNS